MQGLVEWRCKLCKKRLEKTNIKYNKLYEKCENKKKLKLELETERGQEKAWHEKYIKSKAYMAIVIGILILVMTFWLSYVCEISDWKPEHKALCQTVVSGLNCVISIIIGIGISTLVLDFFSYIKYTRDRIKEVIVDKKYIDTLSSREKKKMLKDIEYSLYFKEKYNLEDSLYANIKELIIPLIEDNYYKQYKVHIDCYIDDDKQIIKKTVYKIMDIVCIKEKDVFKIPFSTYMYKIKDMDNSKLYTLESCVHDGEDVTELVKKQLKSEEVDEESVKFYVDYEFQLKNGLNRIETCTITITPLSDAVFSHTITIPCHRYSINYSIHNSDYSVTGYGFAFDDETHKDNIDKIIYHEEYADCYKIRFEDWTLPGNGVVFVINKKNDDK